MSRVQSPLRRAPVLGLLMLVAAASAEAQETDAAPADPDSVLGQIQAQMPEPDPNAGLAAPAGILVLNQERLLAGTLFGQRIQRELETATRALSAENRQIEAQLTDEELRLTELRPTMDPAEFRALANEFDIRVEGIRAAQDAKARGLQTQFEAAQALFFELTLPVLLDLVQSRNAAVLMDSRAVLLSAGTVDITDAAIARVDAELGAGGEAPLVELDNPPVSPQPRPQPQP